MTLHSVIDKFAYLVGEKRKEATQHEKRQLAKQFLEAKKAQCQSWIDNEVFEVVDMRKQKYEILWLADGSSQSKKIKIETSKNVRPDGS